MAQRRGGWVYLSTYCRDTGGLCSPGSMLARRSTDCLDRGSALIPARFQLTGLARLDDCGRACPLAFRVAKRGAWILGDVERGPDPDVPMVFAAGFFDDAAALPRSPASPAAMVRAALPVPVTPAPRAPA